MVSRQHTNFLINTGTATAADLEGLGEEVRRRVYDTSGVMLEWEIERIGRSSFEMEDMDSSFPPKRGAVWGKSCGREREEIGPPISSWPGMAPPSTPSSARNKDVDARIKSAQDDFGSLPPNPKPAILAEKISPDSPALSRELRVEADFGP